MALTQDLLQHALALGFDRAAVIPVGPPARFAAFRDWLDAGYHGEMAYLAGHADRRSDPRLLAPTAKSMIVLAARYLEIASSLAVTASGSLRFRDSSPPGHDPATGRIAAYAWGADYHETLKARLFELDAFLRSRSGRIAPGKVCVDTAPLLERDFAAQAGLGFVGRNTCLITPGLGSWTFLAALLVPEDLSPASPFPHREGGWGVGCGRCTRCLDACPTRAFAAPYVLDARRCISYLTIELRGPIPRDLRPLLGNWVFGCDICQEVCPYNRPGRPPARHGRPTSGRLSLADLLTLDEAGFRAAFRGTPVTRAKRRGLVRNACVAAGNAADPALIPPLVARLADPEPLVRGHAAWALGRIGGDVAIRALAAALVVEGDPWVRTEIALACNSLGNHMEL